MKAFLCIPNEYYRKTNIDINNMCQRKLESSLKPYYGKTSVEVIHKSGIRDFEVYIMEKPKYDGYQSEIQKIIVEILGKYYGEEIKSLIQIKLNYSAFDPSFCPSSDSDEDKEISEQNQKDVGQIKKADEFDYEKLSYNYQALEPRFSFDQVILPAHTLEQIEKAIGVLKVETKVFDEWGLRSIIPEATSALSFYGPPGTGKTMTAEAIAQRLGKKILRATYADIESKFHGEGPKMVKAIFRAAERDNAVLFLDESDSLLSKRLTNVSDGSAQAINSMRSQLLISLESFTGIVIFATNLVINYDKAFLSRLINIEFTNPTKVERKQIWTNHLYGEKLHIPLAKDVDINYLSEKYDFCGREIKNVVKNACVSAALQNKDIVDQKEFVYACEKAIDERDRVSSAKDQTRIESNHKLSERDSNAIKDVIQKRIDAGKMDISNLEKK